jgi:hypothetical protein
MYGMSHSMKQNQMIEEDIALLTLSVEELERYLISKELYWPLFTHPHMKVVNPRSRLTPGNLLLSVARLSCISFEGEKKTLIESKLAEFNQIRYQWKSHWIIKAQLEHKTRLDLWHGYLQDLIEDRNQYARNYTYSVRWRAILQLLGNEEIQFSESALISLAAMDENLKAISYPDAFVWGSEIEPGFPEADFWYLYRKITV